jgi:hypothetical protein
MVLCIYCLDMVGNVPKVMQLLEGGGYVVWFWFSLGKVDEHLLPVKKNQVQNYTKTYS